MPVGEGSEGGVKGLAGVLVAMADGKGASKAVNTVAVMAVVVMVVGMAAVVTTEEVWEGSLVGVALEVGDPRS